MKLLTITFSLVGCILFGQALFIQFISMDLSRYSILDYMLSDPKLFAWWCTVGIPFLVGITYIAIALVLLRGSHTQRRSVAIVGISALLGVLLCGFNIGYVIFAVVPITASSWAHFRYLKVRQS